jgi:hypothetical protein
VPEGPDWRQRQIAADRVLLEHVAPEACFGRHFGRPGGSKKPRPPPVAVPEVLARARADFAPVLFTLEMAVRR